MAEWTNLTGNWAQPLNNSAGAMKLKWIVATVVARRSLSMT